MTSKISAGHLLVKQLETEGVQRVYMVPGESFLDAIDGLYDSPIQPIVGRQEGGIGMMALTEGRLTDTPGVAMVTRGPGAANVHIALHTAMQDATPMVVFVGLIPESLKGRFAFQEFSIEEWFSDCAKAVWTLSETESIATLVRNAFDLARAGRPGPVVIGLPEDRLAEVVEGTTIVPFRRSPSQISAGDTRMLEDKVDSAERPVAIVGGEFWNKESLSQLQEWAENRGVALATDFRAYDLVDINSECWIGSLGFGRDPRLAAHIDEADLLIFLGALRTDVLSDCYSISLQAKTLVVNPDVQLTGHFGRVDHHIVANPSEFIATVPVLSEPTVHSTWLRSAHLDQVKYSLPMRDGTATGVDLSLLMKDIRDRSHDDAIITFGAGNYALWPQRFLPIGREGALVAPKNGAMGVGVPAAVAASLIFPGRQVISFAGDGCFLMNGQELSTGVRNGAQFVLFVIDNQRYGTIAQHQEHKYPGRSIGTDLYNPDFSALAASFGALGLDLERNHDINQVLNRAFSHTGLSLVNVKADSDLRSPSSAVTPLE